MEKTALKVQRYLMIFGMLALAAFAAGCESSDTGWTGAPRLQAPSWRNVAGRRHDRSRRNSWRGTTTPTGGTTTAGGTTAAAGTTGI